MATGQDSAKSLGKNLKEVFVASYNIDVDKSIAINNIQQEVKEIDQDNPGSNE